MPDTFKPFDAAMAPLHRGVNVVEASAGTGKTYSIAMLVLRFVVEKNVPVEELLVVTYTRAATEELRGRIRLRLLEARNILAASGPADADPVLLRWLEKCSDKTGALKRLELALLDMDRAPVFTIHGFCQRMLQEQALESGQLFEMELCADVSQVRQELVEDFWRSKFYDLSPLHCSLLFDSFADPDALYKSVQGVGAEDIVEPAVRISSGDALQEVDKDIAALAQWWKRSSPALEQCFLFAIDGKMFKKNVMEKFAPWWQQCKDFFEGTSERLPSDLLWFGKDALLQELNGSKLRGDAKKEAFLQDWPLAGTVVEAFAAGCEQAILSVRIELALALQENLRKRLQKKGLFSFDDLILQLANALSGEQKEALQQVLAQRFQVALIDEFQDTDAAQYRIFSTLFAGGKHYLFLIGDPKQAIYKFRGADIYAYFAARESADYLLSLAKNYRSNPLLVQGVNDLFLQRADSFASPQLSYNRVEAAKAPDTLQLQYHGKAEAATIYCSMESPHENGVKAWSSGKCMERLQAYVASEIEGLLLRTTIVTDIEESRPLRAGDIAILVRTHKQAEGFQRVLAHARIPSVMSSQKTVFETEECRDLLVVVEAVVNPYDPVLLRRALSCKWFGLQGQQFYALVQDGVQMDAWMERFYVYHRLWMEKGFLAMMNTLLAEESVFETLCALPLAQRQIANIQHLIEIIQEEESVSNLSMLHSLQYISRQLETAEGSEHAQLRLESDEEAVKIVTMHGVKGLEFPVVFAPCLWYRSARLQHEKQCVSFHDEQGRQVADLGSSDFEDRRERALREELAEELRLLYVAVTRASCRSYLFWADVAASGYTTSSRKSALAWALSLESCQDIDEQNEYIEGLCDGKSAEYRLVPAEADEKAGMDSRLPEPLSFSCQQFSRFPLTAEWLMTSYSALAGSVHHSSFVSERIPEGEKSLRIHDLPFGANFGNVVHGVLEDYSFALLAGEEEFRSEVEGQCRRFGVEADTDQLMALLRDVTRTVLTSDQDEKLFSLSDLQEQDVLKEMPFYFHLQEESTERINELLAFSAVVRPIQEKTLKGYLTGFVDLVCRYQGKYYVIDYKSNYLGDFLHDYKRENLTAAMCDHNYGLQYWIYTLVLHRFLANTLPGYSYQESFGGVFYLFARGMRPDCPGNGVFFDRPQLAVLDALLLSLGGS